nr:MarR family transcriptional regulator [Evansella caseinilytica]
MPLNRNDHLLLNYIRGLNKILEEEWQTNARKLGLTLAELHVMWIVNSKNQLSVSDIAKIGLWDRSTVMQMIKRLQEKGLVRMIKSEKDLRVTYVELTPKGKEKREQSRQKEFKLFEFLHSYEKNNEQWMTEFCRFYREVNRYFHGDEFVDWVEETTEKYEKL